MTRFMSASKIKALGDRIAHSKEASTEDRHLLQRLIADYAEPMAFVQDTIREKLGIESTARPKTEKTTIEKLRRERTRLNKMQDLAGMRLYLLPATLTEQDRVAAAVASLFPAVRISDVREKGPYRAVHVIVEVDECLVEVQVRTPLQHAWADVFERLADATDRRIRYGAVPLDDEARSIYGDLLRMSALFRDFEDRTVQIEAGIVEIDGLRERIKGGPIPSRGSPERRTRDRLLRAAAYRRRTGLRLLDEGRQAEHDQASFLHSMAAAIKSGQLRFRRGIVE